MNNRGFTCIELLFAVAILATAGAVFAHDIQSSADWKRSKTLADKAIAQAKQRAQSKETK